MFLHKSYAQSLERDSTVAAFQGRERERESDSPGTEHCSLTHREGGQLMSTTSDELAQRSDNSFIKRR